MKKTLLFILSLVFTMGLATACDDDSSNNNTSECTEGETQNGTTICGLNGEGVFVQSCTDGMWADTTTCTGTDECTNDATQVGETVCNDTGFLIQDCTLGAWVDSANCTVGGCVADATQVGTTVCGLNDEGYFMQLCNAEGTWDDTTECTGTDICVNGTHQDGTTVCNETGVFIQDCTNGAWVDSANCTVGGCTEDATQVGTTVCGLNDEGFFVQLCNATGTWDDTAACTGTDICVNGTTQNGTTVCNGTGVLVQDCTLGAWVDSANCTVGGCTEDATQVGSTACGLNLEGFYVQLCNAAGTWDDTAACTGTDVCVNNDTGTDNCGDGHGIQDLLCTGGAWVNDGSCVCTTGYYWDGATCAEAVTIDWCDVQAPKNYSGTVDATEVIYGQVYGLIGGTKVTGSGAFNPAIEAQLCYDDAGTETCMPAAFNPTCSSCGGDNDEYMAPLNFDTAGDYTYYYKFSGDMGNTWTTCDGTFLATITGGSTPTCDLSGYTLQQQNSAQTLVLPAGIVINAGEVLVIGRNTDEASFRTAWLIDSSVTFTYFNATSHGISINGDETFEISDAAMTSVDGPTSAITSGYNMQRTDTAAAAGDAASWIANSDEMTVATPGTFAGTVSGTGHAVITEYSDHTAFANEFVEIYCDK